MADVTGGAEAAAEGGSAVVARLRTRRPQPGDYAPYYAGYIERVPDGDIIETLRGGIAPMRALLSGLDEAQERYRYGPDKWSVREAIGHLTDTERVFASRLVWFARGDGGPLPGMDQDGWVATDSADERPLVHHLEEWVAVRTSVILLLEGLDAAAWGREGEASGVRFTVPALAWVIAGHEQHHRRLFVERYGLS